MNLDTLLPLVNKPSRYTGNEFNQIKKDWNETAVRIALAFPDLYEIGMSHQGLQILYHHVNAHKGVLADRAYAPDRDMEEALRHRNLPLFGLQTQRPLSDFDVIGITLPYELCYTNILTILDLAGIPFYARERDERFPLIIGGGPCAFNPEPVADFFDAILLGDGEEAILDIANAVAEAKKNSTSREELLESLRLIPGMYVPSLFSPRYDAAGKFVGVEPVRDDYQQVRRRFLADLNQVKSGFPPLVSLTRIVHDRLGIEIGRGCTRGCRFCQAGIIYRPVRERSLENITRLAEQGIADGGYEELALLSLSTGDYSCLSELMVQLMNTFAARKVSVSMPSMRVGTLTPEIMEQIRRVRKTGFTVAPEAGSGRLRQVINKGITEEDLLATCKAAFELGWKLIKFYFMVGLPTETSTDIEAIADLAHKALRAGGRRGRITVSVGTFVPKAHTPFQREPQLSIGEARAKFDLLQKRMPGKTIAFKWHEPRQSFLEGVMARGDRRLAPVIASAWRAGARLDGWYDHFQLDTWLQAGLREGIDLEQYLRRRGEDEPLPWEHLDSGVEESFLRDEFDKALRGEYTSDCRVHGCKKCGVCDFKSIRPVTFASEGEAVKAKNSEQPAGSVGNAFSSHDLRTGRGAKQDGVSPAAKRSVPSQSRYDYRITYSRSDSGRYVSHLEMIQMFLRLFRKAGLPLVFSQGFNPTPKVSFSPALPVGTESMAEYLYIRLSESLADVAATTDRLNSYLPLGFVIHEITKATKENEARTIDTCYEIKLGNDIDCRILQAFSPEAGCLMEVERKGRVRQIDVAPLVRSFEVVDTGKVRLVLRSEVGKSGVKPLELVANLLGVQLDTLRLARVLKVWSRPVVEK